MMKALIFVAMFTVASIFPAAGYANTAGKPPVIVLKMDGAVSPAFSEYLDKGIAAAHNANAQLLVLELNTPGGLLTSTRNMVSAIMESPVPIAVWVTPKGAHAASAGTFLLYAAHISAMDEGTNVGAATPIEMGRRLTGPEKKSETGNNSALEKKSIEDTSAFIRSIAEIRGRNQEWAETAITEAKSITSGEALKLGVTDIIATDLNELLEKVDGKPITVEGGETFILDTDDAPVIEMLPDLRTVFLSIISDPNIAFILLGLGVYGIILEFFHPGTMVSGTVGVICLVCALFALNVLPVNAAGIILLLLGLAFMVAEAFIPSFGVIGIGGFVAFVFGSTIMFDEEKMPGLSLDWSAIWGVGILGLMVIGIIVSVTMKAIRSKVSTGIESMIGRPAKVVEWSRNAGKIQIQGEIWAAKSSEPFDLKKDDKVFVSAVKDLTVIVRTND